MVARRIPIGLIVLAVFVAVAVGIGFLIFRAPTLTQVRDNIPPTRQGARSLPPTATQAEAGALAETPKRRATVTPESASSAPSASGSLVMRNQTIYALDGHVAYKGDVDLKPTFDRIAAGTRDSHANDGTVFTNAERRLPVKTDRQYYREYVIRTQGLREVGPQRLVIGKEGDAYYTADHYAHFVKVK